MDSIQKLKSNYKKRLELQHFDYDILVNITVSDIAYWCEEYLRIKKYIETTSISPSHQLERNQKLIHDIFNIK